MQVGVCNSSVSRKKSYHAGRTDSSTTAGCSTGIRPYTHLHTPFLLYFAFNSRVFLDGTHTPEELAALGLLTFAAGKEPSRKGGASSTAEPDKGMDDGKAKWQQNLVCLGSGLPALQKRLIDRIWANEYVDFTELPPARGKQRPPPQAAEGQIIILQAKDLAPARRVIPDLAT